MWTTLVKVIAGFVTPEISKIIQSYQDRKVSEAELQADVEKALLKATSEIAPSQADVIKAEIAGEDWLQRNWRPLVALSFAFIILFYGLLLPIAVGWLGLPPVKVGDVLLGWIMNAVMVSLGGYIGLLGIADIVKTIMRK